MMYVLHELVFIRSAVTADSVKQNIISSRHNPPVVLSLEPPGDQCSSECIWPAMQGGPWLTPLHHLPCHCGGFTPSREKDICFR